MMFVLPYHVVCVSLSSPAVPRVFVLLRAPPLFALLPLSLEGKTVDKESFLLFFPLPGTTMTSI
jgi:hypothetical protein